MAEYDPRVIEFMKQVQGQQSANTWLSLGGIWTSLIEAIKPLLGEALSVFNDAWRDIADENWDTMLSYMKKAGYATDETVNELKQLKTLPPLASIICYFFTFLNFLKTGVETHSYYSTADLRQNMASRFTPELPDASSAIQAAFVAPEKTGEVRDILKRLGLEDDHIDLLFLARYRLYDENTVRMLWLRGVLTEDDMYMRMRELGYTDTRISEIIQGWEIIPGPSDLLMMVGKEAFEPDIIKKIGLDDEFPEGQVEWLEKQGVSRQWALRYWYAHWDQPSVQQGFEMLHRGVIDWDDLDILFRAVEIPPYWREKLAKVAYQPLTRIDVRRMHDLGVLQDADLVRAYQDLGYDETNAKRMALFTIRYNAIQDRDLTKGEILKGYKEKAIPRNAAKKLLIDLEISEDGADYMLDFADYQIIKSYQDDIIKNIQDRYVQNLIEFPEARSLLNQLNLPALQTDTLLDRWEIMRWKDTKLPSKTDLDKFLKAKIINKDEYYKQMERLGYSVKYTEWYFKLVKG